jgi:hypothetical protein
LVADTPSSPTPDKTQADPPPMTRFGVISPSGHQDTKLMTPSIRDLFDEKPGCQ